MRFVILIALLSMTACADRYALTLMPEARGVGEEQRLYMVTNRKANESGHIKGDRGGEIRFEELSISIPPTHKVGDLNVKLKNPDPSTSYVLTDRRVIEHSNEFWADIQQNLQSLPESDRILTLFIHGYNNSYPESLFRAAQFYHDLQIPGVSVAFSWPSHAQVLRYNYDRDSALYSRSDLAEILHKITRTGAVEINLIGHSMGGMLLMESLQQVELANPSFVAKHMGGVYLISPDIDIGVFQKQLGNFKKLPEPFTVMISEKDKALRLSEFLNGPSRRLGRYLDHEGLDSYPIAIFDVSAFAYGGGTNHFTVANNSTLLEVFQQRASLDKIFNTKNRSLSSDVVSTVLPAGVSVTRKGVNRFVFDPENHGR